jgi:hypothetical protein
VNAQELALSLARIAALSGRAIPYTRASHEQRLLWRTEMLGKNRADLPDWQLEPDERAAISGEVLDERFFRFQEAHGFYLFKPIKPPKRGIR